MGIVLLLFSTSVPQFEGLQPAEFKATFHAAELTGTKGIVNGQLEGRQADGIGAHMAG